MSTNKKTKKEQKELEKSFNWCYKQYGSEHSPFAPFEACPFPNQNQKCCCPLRQTNNI